LNSSSTSCGFLVAYNSERSCFSISPILFLISSKSSRKEPKVYGCPYFLSLNVNPFLSIRATCLLFIFSCFHNLVFHSFNRRNSRLVVKTLKKYIWLFTTHQEPSLKQKTRGILIFYKLCIWLCIKHTFYYTIYRKVLYIEGFEKPLIETSICPFIIPDT